MTNKIDKLHSRFRSIGTGNRNEIYDILANEVPWTHYILPRNGGTATEDWYKKMKIALAKGKLSEQEFKIYSLNPSALSEADKRRRISITQKVGALVKDLKIAIKFRQCGRDEPSERERLASSTKKLLVKLNEFYAHDFDKSGYIDSLEDLLRKLSIKQ